MIPLLPTPSSEFSCLTCGHCGRFAGVLQYISCDCFSKNVIRKKWSLVFHVTVFHVTTVPLPAAGLPP